MMRAAEKAGVKVLVLPELGLTGYTCGDLFYQDTLLKSAEEALATVLEATRNLEVVTAVGLPVRVNRQQLYNCAAIIQKGEHFGPGSQGASAQLWGILREAAVRHRGRRTGGPM